MKVSFQFTLPFIALLLIGQGCFGGPVAIEPKAADGQPLDASGLNCANLTLDGDGEPIDVFKLDDRHCYPAQLFSNPTEPDACDSTHYHYTLLSLDGSQTREDGGRDCGAASNSDIENKGTIYVGSDVMESWNDAWSEISE